MGVHLRLHLDDGRVAFGASLIGFATALTTLLFTSAPFAPPTDVRRLTAAAPADFVRPWLTALVSSAAALPLLAVVLMREVRAGGTTGHVLSHVRKP